MTQADAHRRPPTPRMSPARRPGHSLSTATAHLTPSSSPPSPRRHRILMRCWFGSGRAIAARRRRSPMSGSCGGSTLSESAGLDRRPCARDRSCVRRGEASVKITWYTQNSWWWRAERECHLERYEAGAIDVGSSSAAGGGPGDSTVTTHSVDRAPALHEALIAQLDRQREHVLAGIEGLGERALDWVVAPSGWTLRSMVTHLLYDVEIFWMGAVLSADPSAIARVCDGWSAPSIPGHRLRQEYRAAASNGNRHLGKADLDAEPKWWPPPETFGGPRLELEPRGGLPSAE